MRAFMKRRLGAVGVVLVSVVLASGFFGAVPDAVPTAEATGVEVQQADCLPATGDFAQPGPFSVTVEGGAVTTYYSPTELGTEGCDRHPVILWGNGTFSLVSFYDGLLRHLASHGFIVAAADTSNAGSGQEMLAGLDELTALDGQSDHRFYQKVDLDHIGSTGHSQGGGGAINAAKDPRVDTAAPLQPWLQTEDGVHGPIIFFAGSADFIVWPFTVRGRYDGVVDRLPAAYAELAGASHFEPLMGGGRYAGPVVAWFRWQLMGDDTTARDLFVGDSCGLCGSSDWSQYEANALLQQ